LGEESKKFSWQPKPTTLSVLDRLIKKYQKKADHELRELVEKYHPALLAEGSGEYKKMVALTAKMTLVGHACCETAGFPFDNRRQTIAILYGGACFLADSFIDDYGETMTREYIDRFERMLTKGWFEIRNDREKLFYIILSRIFMLCNVLLPCSRQAIFAVFLAQKRDITLRLNAPTFQLLSRKEQLRMLRCCARDRSGHAIMALANLLVPYISLTVHYHLFNAGALISCTDDHGDCFADLNNRRLTYMNQITEPEKALTKMYNDTVVRLQNDLPDTPAKDILCAFLFRYFTTRLDKHTAEKEKGGLSWAVYE
jgi:hypothetical protein